MDSLKHLIKNLYGDIADNETIIAANNLVGFFRKLESIEENLSHETFLNSRELRNELNHENI